MLPCRLSIQKMCSICGNQNHVLGPKLNFGVISISVKQLEKLLKKLFKKRLQGWEIQWSVSMRHV